MNDFLKKILLRKFSVQVPLMCVACALAGYLVMWVPWRLALANDATNTSIHPDFQLVSIPLLFAVGIVAGWAVPRKTWLWGLFTMAAFPPIAINEMMKDPTSHNLWPIEFFIYGLLTLPGIYGARVGCAIRLRKRV